MPSLIKKDHIDMKYIFKLFILGTLIALTGCKNSESNNNNSPKKPIIEYEDPISIGTSNYTEYLSVNLLNSSAELLVYSKKQNQYEKFINTKIKIHLVETSRAQYWNNFCTIDLDSTGYGSFKSDQLTLLCGYYGNTLYVAPELCACSGSYSIGTIVGYE